MGFASLNPSYTSYTLSSGSPTISTRTLLLHHPELAQIAQHPGVDEVEAGCRRRGVRRGRLARLGKFSREDFFAAVERARKPPRHVVIEVRAREDEAPGSERCNRRSLARIASGRHRERLEERMLAADRRG